MAYFKKKPSNKKEGKIIYCKGIVEDIVVLAINELPYIELGYGRPSKAHNYSAVSVDYAKEGVTIDIFIKIHISQKISDISFKLQEIIRREVESMTEYRVLGVNVNIIDIITNNINANNSAVNTTDVQQPKNSDDENKEKENSEIKDEKNNN